MSTHAVLVAGVDPEWLKTAASQGYDTGSRNDSTKIEASVKRFKEDIKQYKDTTVSQLFLRPGDEAQWQKFVALLQSRKWDAVCLGGGVRTIPQLGEYFTSLVHQVQHDQPSAKLLFPLLPEDIVPALKKYLPEAK